MVREHVLRPVGRWDAAFLLRFLGAHAVPGVEHWDGTMFSRCVRLPEGVAVVVLREADDGALGVGVHGEVDDEQLLRRIRHLSGADDDSAPGESALGADRVVGALVRRRPGLRVPGSLDDAETLLRTVVGQQVSLSSARTTTGRLVEAVGERLPATVRDVVSGVTHLFPAPEQVARLDPDALPMPRARGRCLVTLCRALVEQPALLRDKDRLLALPGIGPWTVDYVRLRTRRDPDVFLATDLAVRRQLEALGVRADRRSVRGMTERWAPYRSIAMVHLWAEYLWRREGRAA